MVKVQTPANSAGLRQNSPAATTGHHRAGSHPRQQTAQPAGQESAPRPPARAGILQRRQQQDGQQHPIQRIHCGTMMPDTPTRVKLVHHRFGFVLRANGPSPAHGGFRPCWFPPRLTGRKRKPELCLSASAVGPGQTARPAGSHSVACPRCRGLSSVFSAGLSAVSRFSARACWLRFVFFRLGFAFLAAENGSRVGVFSSGFCLRFFSAGLSCGFQFDLCRGSTLGSGVAHDVARAVFGLAQLGVLTLNGFRFRPWPATGSLTVATLAPPLAPAWRRQFGHRRGAGGATHQPGWFLPTALPLQELPSGRRQPGRWPWRLLAACWPQASMCCRLGRGRGGRSLAGKAWRAAGRQIADNVHGFRAHFVLRFAVQHAHHAAGNQTHDDGANQTVCAADPVRPAGCSLLTSIILYEKTARQAGLRRKIHHSAPPTKPSGVVATCPACGARAWRRRAALSLMRVLYAVAH